MASWIAELVGDLVVGEEMDATTDHGRLVVLGCLGQALGLVTSLLLAGTNSVNDKQTPLWVHWVSLGRAEDDDSNQSLHSRGVVLAGRRVPGG